METVKRNLEYIQKSLLNGTHKEQSVIHHLMLEETIETVRETTFSYEVPYVYEKHDYHINVFVHKSKKAKASLLCDLRELQHQLNIKNTNVKSAMVLVQKMLQNNLYQSEINRTINKWVNLGNNTTKTKLLKVT